MAGRIPPEFIDQLLSRIDIVDIIDKRVPLKKAGKDFQACCPFHSEKTPSFTVSPQKQFYHCFGCGAHGTAIGFLMDYDHMGFVEAIEELAQDAGLEVPREDGDSSHPHQDFSRLYALLDQANQFFQQQLRQHPQASRAVDYLKRRGLSGEIARDFGIGYAPPGWDNLCSHLAREDSDIKALQAAGLVSIGDSGKPYDRFRDRIMFPIIDARGRVAGFGGRILDGEGPKYLNSPETAVFHKGEILYGLYNVRRSHAGKQQILVVEGYMDAVALARHGIDFAVATLGTATTSEHLNRLFRLTENVCFAFDGDRAGRKAAWRALENALPQIREGRQIRFMFLPEGHDPDSYVNEFGTDAFLEALGQGIALSEFLIEELSSQVDMSTVDGRARLAELARPLVAKIPQGVYRDLLIDSLAEEVGLTSAKLEKMLGNAAPTSAGVAAARGQRRAAERPGAKGQPSVVRHAISLVLNYPDAARKAAVEKLAGMSRKGADLLQALIETVQAEPNITTAGLLERFRHDEQGRHLGKLAMTGLPDDEEFDPAAELAECLDQLAQAGRRERVDFLIEKQRVSGLSEDERAELRQLH